MAWFQTCDGVRRREFLQVGMLSGMGLAMSDLFRHEAHGDQILDGRHAPAKSAIFINLAGGPTHMDTFDLKRTRRLNIAANSTRSRRTPRAWNFRNTCRNWRR